MRRIGAAHLLALCSASAIVLLSAGTSWDAVVTPVAPSYLSLRSGPPFADQNGLATRAPAGAVPTSDSSSDFGDWEARYNYYPATRLLPCDPATLHSSAGCAGVNPEN